MITLEEAKQALIDEDHFVVKTGWLKSYMERLSVDLAGNPIPWYVYSFVKFMEPRLNKNMSVFEFGCGHSTLWYAKRVKEVYGVEEKLPWFNRIKERSPSNVSIAHSSDSLNCAGFSLAFHKDFDIICIDGENRVQCAYNSLGALKDDGVIIWDNSGTDADKEGYDYLARHGFKRLDFHGLTPICTVENCTSVFYRKENCFNI